MKKTTYLIPVIAIVVAGILSSLFVVSNSLRLRRFAGYRRPAPTHMPLSTAKATA